MRLGIMSALDVEMNFYLEKCDVRDQVRQAGLTFHEAYWSGHELVLVRAGVGKVNSAVCAQTLINTFEAASIICTGSAGSLHPDLDIGDIVVAEDCVQHDVAVAFLGIPRGQIPFTDLRFFETATTLRKRAANVTLSDRTVRTGRILTGDVFIEDEETRRQLRDELGGVCVEMEGAAVGQVCAMNSVPFLVVRAISDHADGTSDIDFDRSLEDASRASSELVLRLLDEYDAGSIALGEIE